MDFETAPGGGAEMILGVTPLKFMTIGRVGNCSNTEQAYDTIMLWNTIKTSLAEEYSQTVCIPLQNPNQIV